LETVVRSPASTADVGEFRHRDVEEFPHLPPDTKCRQQQQFRHRPEHSVSDVVVAVVVAVAVAVAAVVVVQGHGGSSVLENALLTLLMQYLENFSIDALLDRDKCFSVGVKKSKVKVTT